MMTVVYVLLGFYLLFVGSRQAGIWGSNAVVEGVPLMLAGLFLLISQILERG